MSSKMTLPAIAVVVFGGLAAAAAGFAQNAPAANPAPQGQGMMGGTNPAPQSQSTMGGTGNMADMMSMMRQMTRMMENCDRMMESHMQQPATAPQPEKKG